MAQQHQRSDEGTRRPGSAESQRGPEQSDGDGVSRDRGALIKDHPSEDPEAEDVNDPSKD